MMFQADGTVHDPTDDILRALPVLSRQCDHLIVITNEVGADCRTFTDATPQYIQILGRLNAALARRFDCVCELVCGIPLVHKGQLPHLPVSGGDPNLTLIIGGEASGKRTYAGHLGYNRNEMSAMLDSKPVLYDLQTLAADTPAVTQELLDALCKKRVVICSEVGSGVIPLHPTERDARIRTGILCNLLAQRAGTVIRMVCGIPTILKR